MEWQELDLHIFIQLVQLTREHENSYWALTG